MANFSFSLLGEKGRASHKPLQVRSSVSSNLQKSLHLLDSSVAAPPSFPHGAIGTPPHRRRTLATNVSFLNPDVTLGGVGERTFCMPSTPNFKTSHAASVVNVTAANAALMLEESNDLAASTSVFTGFLEKIREFPLEHQLFELVVSYEDICNDQVSLLKRITNKTKPGMNKMADVHFTLNQLEDERATWQLVRMLYTDRLSIANTSDVVDDDGMELSSAPDAPTLHVGEKDVVDRLFETDAEVRQVQIVIDWLEAIEKEKMDNFYEKVEFFTDKAEAWENSLHSLQQSKLSGHSAKSHVTELDPDAPIRQNKPLAELDREDEARLQKYLYALIRSGQFDKAQSMCHHVGQSWKAATLEGWRLHHDSNFEMLGPDGQPTPVDGNPLRKLWKNAAWALSDDDRLSLHERALYAALTGNLKRLLPVVDSWEDALWAYCRTLVDQRTEEILEQQSVPFASMPLTLPPRYSEKELTIEQVFEEMEKINWNKKVSQPSRMQLVQSFVISGDTDGLLDIMHGWLTEDIDPDSGEGGLTPHLIRFMAHLVLFLRAAGLCNISDELSVSLILKYVEVLIASKMTNLVATYTSHLPSITQVEVYAAFLEGVSEDAQRRHTLELAKECGLEVRSITKMVVENIRQQSDEDAALFSPISVSVDKDVGTVSETATTTSDKVRISSLDWLLYDPGQRSEALKAANTLCRCFLLQRKIAAAKETFTKLPAKILEEISNNWESETGHASLPAEDENAIREYFCIKAYLESVASFNDWFKHFHKGKPNVPSLTPGSTFTEKIAHEQQMKTYEIDQARWQQDLDEQSNATVERIYNVLLFVDGGWMVDARSPDEHDSASNQRLHQLSRLREQCLPALAVLLYSIFHATCRFHDCLQLADIIAAEKHALYKVFRKIELQDFLQKLRMSALALLEQDGMDSFGYPL